MRSASPDRSRSLVGRVAQVTAVAAALGALIAALGAGLLSDGLLRAQEDRRLIDAAKILAREITELAPDAAARAAEEEATEIAHTGIRIALFREEARLGGDRALARGEGTEACATIEELRRCAFPVGDYVVVAAADRGPIGEYRRLFLIAAGIAVVVAVLLGLLLSRRAATWATDPLVRLDQAVRAFSIDEPSWEGLRTTYGCDEVDTLRGALHDLVERLQHALGLSRQFAADAAHELRTPLTTLRAELELLLESSAASSARDALGRARDTTEGLTRLLERLLVLASPGREELPREAVALVDIASEVVQRLPPPSRDRIRIESRADGIVRGDPALLSAMIANGIENALKFSADDVVVTIAEAAGAVTVEINDRGPGVDDADRQAVFQPFYRSAAVRAEGVAGHGIGLALIAHVARAHGGGAAFAEVSAGARLRISIPSWGPDR